MLNTAVQIYFMAKITDDLEETNMWCFFVRTLQYIFKQCDFQEHMLHTASTEVKGGRRRFAHCSRLNFQRLSFRVQNIP